MTRDTTEPDVSILDSVPANALFVEKLAYLARDGKAQHALHWREYVRRAAKRIWPKRRISQDTLTEAEELAGRMA
jgi:hypothetical protein